MTSKPGPRKPAPKTKRSRPSPANPVQPAAPATRSNRGERLSSLEAKVGALEAELKKSERRLKREVGRRERAESELHHSESWFQSLAAFGDHQLFVMDAQGRYLFSSRKDGLSVGGDLLTIVGRNQREFHLPEVADLYEAKMNFVLETGLGVEFEHTAPEPDGLHHHLDTLYPIAERGRIVALGGICRDVTGQKDIQHRLGRSEERFRRVFDLGLIGMAITSVDKGWLEVNDRLCGILGFSREELLRKSWAEITHPDDLAVDVAWFNQVLAGAIDAYSMEKRFIRKDGCIIHAEISVRCLRRPDRSVEYFVAFVQDITEWKRALEQLRASEQRLQWALDATAEGVWDWNIRTGEVLFSRNWKTSLGYCVDEVPDRLEFWESIVHPEDMPRVRHILNEHFEGRSPVFVCENRLRMKSGAYRLNLDRGMVVEWDESGKPARMVGTDTDIADIKKAHNALLEANKRLEAIFNASHQAVFLIDTEGIIIAANEELARRLDSRAAELIGKSIYGFLPDELSESRKKLIEEAVRTRQTITFEDTRQDQNISQTVCPVLDAQGNVMQLAVYAENVTNQRRSEQALRESEERYRRIVETASEGIWSMDGGHRTTYVNRHMADMLGYAPEEMIGRRVDAFMFAEDADDHSAKMAIREKGVGGVYERRFRRKDGRELWTSVAATALKDAEGNFAGSFAMFTDVTERKRGEEALLQYENIVSSSTDAMSLVGCDYVYMTVNNTYLRRTGLARDQIVGKPVAEIMGQAAFDEVIKPRIDQCLAGDTIIYSEWFDFPAEGRMHVEVTYSPCRNRKQEVTGAVVIARDITERKKAEETIAHSEELLKRTQRLARVGGWEWDLQARAMSWTEETYRIHEIAPEEVVPGSAEHIARSLACYDEPDRLRIMEAFRRCAEEGNGYDYEVPFTTAKGRRLWVRTIAEAVWDGGKIAKVAGNLVDITERKRSEEVLQARLRLSDAAGKIGMEELLRQALDETERITGSSSGFVHFFDEDQKALSLQMWSTHTLEKLCSAEGQGRHYGLDEAGVWADCIRERRPVVHNDYSALPHRKGMPAGHAPVVRELVVPILRNERIVAVLGVGNKPQEYDSRDVEMVQSMADLAWDIVMRKKAEEQMDLQARVLDQTSDRVCITDLDGVIRYVNEAECHAVKRSRSELIGRHISVFGEDVELGATQQEVIDSTLANGKWRGEVVNFASNGAQSMVDLRTFLVRSLSDKAIAMCGIGTDITELKKSESELRLFQGKLRDLYHQLQNSREDERQHISRKIHDELGQNITALQIDIAWLKRKIDPAQTHFHEKLELMAALADSTLETVRRVSAELRPGILDALGLAAAVDWLVKDFETRNEIQGTLRIEPEEIDVEPNLATDVFRVLQETLTNISRHAQASMVWVTLRQTPDEIHLNVIDNGIGISAEQHLQSGSLGFLGIRERLLSWGGTLNVQGLPGEGTSIMVSIPLQGKEGLI